MKNKKQIIKELQQENERLHYVIQYQTNVIREFKKCCANNDKFIKEIAAHQAPAQFIECKSRKTSYLIFNDGHYEKVKLAAGDKHNPEIALMYLLVKNSYDMNKLKELLFNKKNLKVGEVLPIKINRKK